MRVAVTGSTGLVGGALLPALEAAGHEVAPIERRDKGGLFWTREGEARLTDGDGRGPDAVVHLAGAPIAAKRWNAAYKEEIRASRVEGTRALVDAMARLETPPKVLVSASAVAVYGPGCGDRELAEDAVPDARLTEPAPDYLTDVAYGWEREALRAKELGVERVVRLRIGIVLDRAGGALEKLLPIFKLGGGAPLSSGKQWMAWSTLDDLVRVTSFALEHPTLDGAVNAVTPEPVTNAVFTKALAKALRRPVIPGVFVPRFALRLAVGEFADAALLASHRAVPARLDELGFDLAARDLPTGLTQALGRGRA